MSKASLQKIIMSKTEFDNAVRAGVNFENHKNLENGNIECELLVVYEVRGSILAPRRLKLMPTGYDK